MSVETKTPPLISIVIPTRNRVRYATSAIESILEISDPRLELVIQDNSDTHELEHWVTTRAHDARLRYNYTERPLSFIHNFDIAAGLARGEYVCFIGDDDGVNPEIVEAAFWAKSMNLDALAVRPSAHYLWRGTDLPATLFTNSQGGSLSLTSFSKKLRYADVEKEMERLIRNGGLYYLNTDLPKLYHGLVHRRCLEAIHARTGAYFGGLSPDTFASLAVACVARNVAVIDYPLTIPGSCQSSGSIMEGSLKRHSKRLEDAPHLRYRGEYEWCPLVPRIYTVETLWVDSSLAALRAMGREDLVRQLNLPKLAAYCFWANRGVARIVLHDLFIGLRLQCKSLFVGCIQFGWVLLKLLFRFGASTCLRIWNRLLIMAGMRIVRRIDGIEDMVQASRQLTSYLKENGHGFSDCVSWRPATPAGKLGT